MRLFGIQTDIFSNTTPFYSESEEDKKECVEREKKEGDDSLMIDIFVPLLAGFFGSDQIQNIRHCSGVWSQIGKKSISLFGWYLEMVRNSNSSLFDLTEDSSEGIES